MGVPMTVKVLKPFYFLNSVRLSVLALWTYSTNAASFYDLKSAFDSNHQDVLSQNLDVQSHNFQDARLFERRLRDKFPEKPTNVHNSKFNAPVMLENGEFIISSNSIKLYKNLPKNIY